ncbi:cyclin-dependent kinase C-2 C-like [Primulina eburnea]|uniref:cyclin-dependent kinase C-2 C-like n=1 Tax=Primulina eburnea TaxID=1245227 RepID=UPI003C6C42AE
MGCISSKNIKADSPEFDDSASVIAIVGAAFPSHRPRRLSSSGPLHVKPGFGPLEKIKEEPEEEEEEEEEDEDEDEEVEVDKVAEEEESGRKRHGFLDSSGNLKALKKGSSEKKVVFSIKFGRLIEGEHVAAGWPAWLSAVAGEAIDGWLPLQSNKFERFEKIGQGTYSSVYRARDVETGKLFALKKVRFDNFQPESVRFMAREITILRKLDHPNIIKLEGVITSRLSCSIYLVFEYMEHDLSGLLSCPDIKFSDSQIKCYMKQLLSGLEHCHSRGVMHRDIKVSNILVNNEGILKIADFGLANFLRSKNKQPLTSRVVTLWYRPPELLLGATSYGESVDLWSVGCVFAELFLGRPLFKGRNEVEQLHKIFKLCGSPPDEYWKTSRLPLATMFKPQHPYECTLRERCKEFPKSAVRLIETFLSIEPYKRGTATSSLDSVYFNTKPYACDPSSLPKFPPNKEIDAKLREEARRKKTGTTARVSAGSRNSRNIRKTLQEPSDFCRVVPTEEVETNMHGARGNHGGSTNMHRRRGGIDPRMSMNLSYDTKSEALSEASQMTHESQGSSIRSVPVQVTGSNGFAWGKRQKQQDVFKRLHSHHTSSRSQKFNALEPSSVLCTQDYLESDMLDTNEFSGNVHSDAAGKRPLNRERVQIHHHRDSLDKSDSCDPQELSLDYNHIKKKKGRIGYSGSLIHQSQEIDSIQHSQTLHRSRFYKDL